MKLTTNLGWKAFGDIQSNTPRGFTKIDFLAALAGLAMLGSVILPGLAQTNGGSDVAVCSGNLRQIAQEWRAWAGDHGQRYPWRVAVQEGGAFLAPNAWSYFLVLSNRLDHPRVVACPSDTRKPAAHFGRSPGGLAWPAGGENNAVSYFVGVDTLYDTTNWVLAGDRNFTGGRHWVGCRNLTGGVAYDLGRSPQLPGDHLAWTNSIHGANLGNLALSDGSVQTTTSESLNTIIRNAEGYSVSSHHILPPY
jgi:hypothetical protein